MDKKNKHSKRIPSGPKSQPEVIPQIDPDEPLNPDEQPDIEPDENPFIAPPEEFPYPGGSLSTY